MPTDGQPNKGRPGECPDDADCSTSALSDSTGSERPSAVDSSPETARTKAALRRLVGSDDRIVIERAAEAVDDIDAAAAFVEEVGLAELELAIEATDDPDRRKRGERALAAFRRFRAAARGEDVHFHHGRGTDLRRGVEDPFQ